ncbi:hypothetical protein LJK88_16895 [Paenibacillus sp. P26]|nr:hypothetical protein LJK88_16895 [Paenibacillus sp. P26]
MEEWLYLGLAGIGFRYDEAAETFGLSIKPAFPQGLEQVKAEHRIPAGLVRVGWTKGRSQRLSLGVDIPVNCTAEVTIPAPSLGTVKEHGVALDKASGIEIVRFEDGEALLRVHSGRYHFEVN